MDKDALRTGDWVRITAKEGTSLDGFPLGDITGALARVDSLEPDSVVLNIDWNGDEIPVTVLPQDFEREPDGPAEGFRNLGKRLSDALENPDVQPSGNGFFAEFDPLVFSDADEAALRRLLPVIADDAVEFLDRSLRKVCETLMRRMRSAGLAVPDLPDSRADRQRWEESAFAALDEAGRKNDFYPSYRVCQLFVEADRKGNDVEIMMDFNGTQAWGHFPNPEKPEELLDEIWRRKRRQDDYESKAESGKRKNLRMRP